MGNLGVKSCWNFRGIFTFQRVLNRGGLWESFLTVKKMDLTAKLVRRERVQNRSEGISDAPGVVDAFPKGTKALGLL